VLRGSRIYQVAKQHRELATLAAEMSGATVGRSGAIVWAADPAATVAATLTAAAALGSLPTQTSTAPILIPGQPLRLNQFGLHVFQILVSSVNRLLRDDRRPLSRWSRAIT